MATAGSVVADEATRRGTRDATERWWGVLARSRYLPRFIREHARLRWMAQVDERRVAGRDPGDNRDTRIPVGEQVLVPVFWLTELYTPTTLDGLLPAGLPDGQGRRTGSQARGHR